MIPAWGHEFWIDPHDFSVQAGDRIVADIRVGQTYGGSAYAYLPRNFHRFEIAAGDTVAPVKMRLGDRPALDAEAPAEGLNAIVHVTRDYDLTYDDWGSFVSFVTHKGAAWVPDAHEARGLPREDVTEVYSRHAKSLVAVGDGAGADRPVGLTVELVALANPYTDDLSAGFPVRVLYEGAPRTNAQVEIFEKDAEGEVGISTVTTDADGVAVVPVMPGHTYLLDHVVLRESDADDAMWESLWGSLTFAVPG